MHRYQTISLCLMLSMDTTMSSAIEKVTWACSHFPLDFLTSVVLTENQVMHIYYTKVTQIADYNKKHLKNVGPIRHCEPLHAACFTLPFTRCRYCRTPPLSHAACASMSTTTSTTMTTRDRGDRYGPMEWAQLGKATHSPRIFFIHHRTPG